MGISPKSIKILWAASGNICAYPKCNTEITAISKENEAYTIGEMAHIKGENKGSCRYDATQSDKERNSHENLILLCPTHHTKIDKVENLSTYTVEYLIEMKKEHIKNIKSKLKSEKVDSLDELKCRILPYLTDNYTVWNEYGPLSIKARQNPHSTSLYETWLHQRLEKIIPNNRKILELITTNRHLFKSEDHQIISDFITHVESYEVWVYSSNTYEVVKPFPQKFNDLIRG